MQTLTLALIALFSTDSIHYIFITVPEPVNARVNVSTVRGVFSSAIQHTRQEGQRRGRFTVVFGTGVATVEVQTFAGGIVLRIPEKNKPED